MRGLKEEEVLTQVEFNGELVEYDACSESSLEEAKAYYEKAFIYFTSSKVSFIDGVRQNWDKEHHFFKYK